MIYKYTSVYGIVEKLYRDYDHQEELDIWDVVEWAGEALEFIGAGQQYDRRVVELDVNNNIARLPDNFHSNPIPSLNGRPMNLATGAFAPMSIDQDHIPPLSSQNTSGVNVTPNNNAPTNINTGQDRVNGFEVDSDNFPRSGEVSAGAAKQVPENYYIRDGVFVASFNTGTILLEYRAIKTDKNGFPEIPDLVQYKTAITKYVQKMLDHRDMRKGKIPVGLADRTEADWQWYCKSARATANMPNLVYAEAIKNQWVKLRPNQIAAQTFWNDGTLREMKKLK